MAADSESVYANLLGRRNYARDQCHEATGYEMFDYPHWSRLYSDGFPSEYTTLVMLREELNETR